MNKTYLYEQLNFMRKLNMTKEVPNYIIEGMSNKINLRDYQKHSLENLITYSETEQLSSGKRTHLLFHMATGSGKTVIMASSILYYYKQGYRNFLFFVNSTNIIEKTISNFTNKTFSKFLFNDIIEIDGKHVEIKKVDNFQYTDKDSINICFTTIQGLHWDIWQGKENSLSINDFEDNKVVMISDEAHHINADTALGKPSKEELEDNKSWEYTINKIFDANKDSVLLEFTATIDLRNNYIREKYQDKIIFDYPLSKFRESGYTKELVNMSTNTDLWERTLQALIISQFRLKMFQLNKVNAKPVILLKSQKIVDSQKFYNEFFERLANLSEKEIINIKNLNENNEIFQNAFNYFEQNNISIPNLIHEIKLDFSEENAIIMNQKDQMTPDKQRIVNTLEDPTNPYRIIFTVDMLNEGWDVLNLFDIVRLYNTRQGGAGGTVSKFTIREAQLIGRGARYFPFKFEDGQEVSKRKYDNNVDANERICETLLYHSQQDSKYIDELRRALKQTGLLPTEEPKEIVSVLKDNFIKSNTYKSSYIFVNKRVEKSRENVTKLPEKLRLMGLDIVCNSGAQSLVENLFDSNTKHDMNIFENIQLLIRDIPFNIKHKAIRSFPNLFFNSLKDKFPNLSSIKEFLNDENYMGLIKLNIKKIKHHILTNEDLLMACTELMKNISEEISKIDIQYEGTKEFEAMSIANIIPKKTRRFVIVNEGSPGVGISQGHHSIPDKYRLDLSDKDWFVYDDNYGTTEEKSFIKYFNNYVLDLKKYYDEVYLIRNEQSLSIYSFENGYKFQPDYILILIKNSEMKHYQVFIEPKGDHLLENDKWKEDFLLQINKEGLAVKTFADDYKYKIWGLPFYNENNNLQKFNDALKEIK